MERFHCQGGLTIRIDLKNSTTIYIALKHNYLHTQRENITVSDDIKDYIRNHLNILPREIYNQLIRNTEINFPIEITDKQVHYW